MRIDLISLFPEMIAQVSGYGILGRAIERDIVQLHCWNPRDFTTDNYKTVDDRPYGGGPGMVMKAEPLSLAIDAAKSASEVKPKVVYLSPQGERLTQAKVDVVSRCDGLILICGRYEGVDERLIEQRVDEQWSVGDYVLAGGELPALLVIEAITRLLPGALGNTESARQDSFVDGLLDCEHYTRPEVYNGVQVPKVLLSGDHAKIERWRLKQSLGRTAKYRPDLLAARELSEIEQILLDEFRKETGDQ